MRCDIVTPGTWQDSFESRFIDESIWNTEITGIHSLLLLCKSFFESEHGKHIQELFSYFPIYINDRLAGEYSKGEVTLDPVIEWHGQKGYFKNGIDYGLVFPVDLCLTYGINSKTVKRDTKHHWR